MNNPVEVAGLNTFCWDRNFYWMRHMNIKAVQIKINYRPGSYSLKDKVTAKLHVIPSKDFGKY